MKKTFLALFAIAALSACATGVAPRSERANGAAYADFLVGRVATLREDHTAAADRYFAALAHAPATPELIEGALDAALAAGDVRRARLAARMAKEQRADFASARLVRAVDAITANRWSAASGELRGLNGDTLQALIGRILSAWTKAGEGRTAEALAEFGAISVDPQGAGLFDYQRAMIFDLAGRREEAAAAYQTARAGQFWIAPALVRDADFMTRIGRGGELRALYRDSVSDFGDPDFARAVAAAESGGPVAREPLTPARGAAIGLYSLGSVLLEDRDADRALAMLTLALMLDPSLDAARLKFADGQSAQGRPEEARAALNEIASNSPYSEVAQVKTAFLLRSEERGEEALAVARGAAEKGGRLARFELGNLYSSLERWQEADATYSTIIEGIARPQASDWVLYFYRAIARERMERWPLAEADIRRALELSPDRPEALNYLGYGWIDRGENLEEGLALIQRAVALRPDSGQIIDSLGWAYFRMGDYRNALDHLERAVELEPADPVLNDHLGDALWRLDRRTEARYQWSRALTLKPSETERAAIEGKLTNGLPPIEPAASAAR